MREAAAWLPSLDHALRYFSLKEEYEGAEVPTINPPNSGSVPGMLRWICGSVGTEFHEAGAALVAWARSKGYEVEES